MIISHSHKFIFIHIHRTGGTTIANLIQNQIRANAKIITQHGHYRTSESEVLEAYPNYYTFSFVRNPWERMLSWYFLLNPQKTELSPDKIKMDFERFLKEDLKKPEGSFHPNQLDYLTDVNGKVLVNRVGRFENYLDDLRDIFRELNVPVFEIPHINKSIATYSPSYYTEESIEIVANMCKADIDFFGYTFNPNLSHAVTTSI